VSKNGEGKQRQQNQRGVVPLRVPYSAMGPVADYNYALTASSTGVTSFTVLDPLLAASGILASFPQRATPVYQNGVFRLRTRIVIHRVEVRMVVVGAQSNAVLAADLYNTLRTALYKTRINYGDSSIAYLTTVLGGTNLQDIEKIHADRTFSLPSQAYDATITTPTPQVLNWDFMFKPNMVLDCYSTNATGSGAAWDTNGFDLMFDHVSDSTVAPHPTIGFTLRLCYSYEN
jgi:hypothetical protein